MTNLCASCSDPIHHGTTNFGVISQAVWAPNLHEPDHRDDVTLYVCPPCWAAWCTLFTDGKAWARWTLEQIRERRGPIDPVVATARDGTLIRQSMTPWSPT